MFLKKICYEDGNGTKTETLYQCEKVIVRSHLGNPPLTIYLEPIREIMIDKGENVGLYVMNDEGRTIEVIRHLEPVSGDGRHTLRETESATNT